MVEFYNVTFNGDYFSMVCTVTGAECGGDSYAAIETASDRMREVYGWNVWDKSNEVIVEEVDN